MKALFHTSFCGSTLLASILSEVSPVLTEPSWTHDTITEKSCKIDFSKQKTKEIIKYPSALCHGIPYYNGKVVFIYRSLVEHILYLKYIRKTIVNYEYYDYFQLTKHPKLVGEKFETPVEKSIFLWLNRIMWSLEKSDVFYIHSEYFFKNKEKSTKEVCDFFDLSQPRDFGISSFHVKKAGLNHNDRYLNTSNLPVKDVVGPSYGSLRGMEAKFFPAGRETLNWIGANSNLLDPLYKKDIKVI